jgi:hypothetical protein
VSANNRKFILLFGLLLLFIGFWIIRKPPQPSSDDYVYLESAKLLLSGEYSLNESPKNHRFVVFAPVALFIRIFGESPWIISLWPLICSCTTLIILFFFLKKYSSLTHAFASCLLLATNTLQIDYSASLFPDVIVGMFSFLFLAEIYKARLKDYSNWQHAIASVLFFFTGFLAKEIIIFVLLFAAAVFLWDLKNRIHLLFWKKFLSLILVTVLAFISGYYSFTGDVNFIYNSIDTRHSEFYTLQSSSEIVKRLTYQPAIMIALNVGYIILFILTIIFLTGDIFKSIKNQMASPVIFFMIYFLVLLTTYWFIPISFGHFTLIHLDPRMWMLLLVPLYIIGGFVVTRIIEEKNNRSLSMMILLFAISALTAIIFVSPQRSLMYFMFVLSGSVVFILKRKDSIKEFYLTLLLLAPAIIIALRFTTANSNFLIH